MRHLLFLFAAALASMTQDVVTVPDASGLPLLSPDLADRKMAKLRLMNGMELIVVSDERADHSAAAVTVEVGSWSDPQEFPGMAHFCEHMLFMGTEKYPDENAFMANVTDMGGMTNAFTASDRTVYMFSSNPEGFSNLLDHFAHFFIDPLFKTANIAREMHAVDQEFAKNVEHDGWRIQMILKELGNPLHPNRMFNCGNSETLSHIPQSALQKWHKEHYSANRMKAIIYSSMKLDKLKELAVSTFNAVPVTVESEKIDPSIPLTTVNQHGTITYIKPVKNEKMLMFLWELPPNLSIDSTKSAELIAYTLKRGQKYNLYEKLKKEDLIESLNISVDDNGGSHKFFEISIELTDHGMKKIDEIGQNVFQAISLIQSTGIPAYLFHEKNELSQIKYQYHSRTDAFTYVTKTAELLPDEALESFPKNILLGSSYSPKAIGEAASYLKAEKCIILVLGFDGVKPERQEKWLGGEYAVRPIPSNWLHAWQNAAPNHEIRLPEPNLFVPTDLHTIANLDDQTILISKNDEGVAYYSHLPEFKNPEAAIRLHILSPELKPTARSQVLSALFASYFTDMLHPTLSSAKDAGLSAEIFADRSRIQIKIDGFSEKAILLLQEILHEFPPAPPSKEKFLLYLAYLEKECANGQKDLAAKQALNLLQSLIQPEKASKEEKLAALKTIEYEDFLLFSERLLQKTYIEAFFSGNMTLKDAESAWLDVIHVIGAKEPFLKKDHPEALAAPLPVGPYSIQKETAVLGNAALLSLDFGTFSHPSRAAQELLSMAVKEAFFNELRTKQKTGYIATTESLNFPDRLYQFFVVQSISHQPQDLLYRFELFFEDFLENFSTNISPNRFTTLQESAIHSLKNSCCNLKAKADLFDKLAFQYNADFDYLTKRINAIQNLNYEEFSKTSRQFLSRANRKRLAILFEGKLASPFAYLPITPDQLAELAKGNFTLREETTEMK